MKRLLLRISTALVTFSLGTAAATIYSYYQKPRVPVSASKPASRPSCLPGGSLTIPRGDILSYFPPGLLSSHEWHDQFRTKWYTKHLIAMGEAPLYPADVNAPESYRFLWLRSFHHPIAVRIWKCESEHFVTVKEMSGRGGYEPGNVIVHRTQKVSESEWNEFLGLLQYSDYWNLPTEDEELAGTDGAQWILEAAKQGRYQLVDRWSPQNGYYREACLYALKLSGTQLDDTAESMY